MITATTNDVIVYFDLAFKVWFSKILLWRPFFFDNIKFYVSTLKSCVILHNILNIVWTTLSIEFWLPYPNV